MIGCLTTPNFGSRRRLGYAQGRMDDQVLLWRRGKPGVYILECHYHSTSSKGMKYATISNMCFPPGILNNTFTVALTLYNNVFYPYSNR